MHVKTATRIAAATAASMLAASAAAAVPAPLAPAYPGATLDTAADAAHARVYLSKAPLAEVRDWYQQRFAQRSRAACGRTDADEGCGRFQQQCETAARTDRLTRCTDFLVLKWNAIPPGGSMVEAYNAGVTLTGWGKAPAAPQTAAGAAPPMTGRMAQAMARMQSQLRQTQAASRQELQQADQAAGMDFGRLESIPDMPFVGLKQEVIAHRHTQKELDAVYRRYRYLTTSEYPMVKGDSGPIAYDKLEFSRCKQKYLTQESYLPGTRDTNRWNDWLGCLRKLAAHAYRTRIVIDVD